MQRVAGTTDSDWEIDRSQMMEKSVADCQEGWKRGDVEAMFGLNMGHYMDEGLGGDYASWAVIMQAGLLRIGRCWAWRRGDVEDAVRHAVEDVRFQPMQMPSSKEASWSMDWWQNGKV